jgi:hypothetical protein
MNLLNIPVQLVLLDLISILAVMGVGYYAAKMFYHMRSGRLERGWLPMIYGAAIIAVGYFFLTLEDFFLAYSFFYVTVDYLGTAICSAGLIVVMLGLRVHYKAWSNGKRLPRPVGLPTGNEKNGTADELDLR